MKTKPPMTMKEIEDARDHERKYHPDEFYVLEDNKDNSKEIKFKIKEKIGKAVMNVHGLKKKGIIK